MYEIDTIRGFAYRGKKGFVIEADQDGLYIMDGNEKIYLAQVKTREIDDEAVNG